MSDMDFDEAQRIMNEHNNHPVHGVEAQRRRKKILYEIVCERKKQDDKWGEQNHAPEFWLAILVEEVGEVGKAICEHKEKEYRLELIQVAAVALSMVECSDRNATTGDGT